MTPTSWGWLVLAFPLAGTIVISLGWRSLPARMAGWLASAMILAAWTWRKRAHYAEMLRNR